MGSDAVSGHTVSELNWNRMPSWCQENCFVVWGGPPSLHQKLELGPEHLFSYWTWVLFFICANKSLVPLSSLLRIKGIKIYKIVMVSGTYVVEINSRYFSVFVLSYFVKYITHVIYSFFCNENLKDYKLTVIIRQQ